MKRPIIIVLISYLLGIFIFEFININIQLFTFFFLLLVILFYTIGNKKTIIIIISLLLAIINTNSRYPEINKNIEQNTVIKILNRKDYEDLHSYEAKIINTENKDTKVLFYSKDFLEINSFVNVNAEIRDINSKNNFRVFNKQRYYKTKDIHFELKIKNINNIYNHKNIKTIIKDDIKKLFDDKLNFYPAQLLKSMIISEKYYQDEEVFNSFRNLGLAHILAISGLHISIMIKFLEGCGKYLSVSKKVYSMFIIMMLLFYGYLINFPVSLIRTLISYIILIISIYTNNVIDRLNILLLTILIILIINPFFIYSIAFYLSFLSVFGIYYVNKKLSAIFYNSDKKILLPFSIQISIFPILIFSYNSINIASVFINILLVSIISLGILLGFLFSVFRLSIIAYLINGLFFIIELIIISIEKISDIFIIYFPSPSLRTIVIYYVTLMILLNYKMIAYKIKKYKKQNYIYLASILIIAKLVLTNNIYINFIDIGQGDSVLIRDRRTSILYDTGGQAFNSEVSGRQFYDYLYKNGVNTIDKIFISHEDFDHYGNLKYIIGKINIKKIYANKLDGFKINTFFQGDYIDLGNIKIKNIYTDINGNDNDSSMVLLIKIYDKNLLLTGDIEKGEGDIIVNETIDFLKVSHHGSKHSTRDEFLDNNKITHAFISAGKYNRYGHPSDEVLKRLNDRNIDIFRTDIDGNIEIRINRFGYFIRPYNHKFDILELFRLIIFY